MVAGGPRSTLVRLRLGWSGAATTKPHEASAAVSSEDCVRKPANPWLKTTSGNLPFATRAPRTPPLG